MYLPRLWPIITAAVLILHSFGCASTNGPGIDSNHKFGTEFMPGLRAPGSSEIVPADIEMQWHNIRFLSACHALPEAADGWQTRFYWLYILWGRLPDDTYCRVQSVEQQGKDLAQGARDKGLLNELLATCLQTEAYVNARLNKRVMHARWSKYMKEGIAREMKCMEQAG